MPSADCPSLLIHYSNRFIRHNNSRILGRLFRDHELKYNFDSRNKKEGGKGELIRINTFYLVLTVTLSYDIV